MGKLFKFGEAMAISESSIQSSEAVFADPEIGKRFQKLATGLKRIAPKANDFLYFSAIMMHAAEASTIDSDGKVKRTAGGQPVTATWEKKGESVRWVCNDPSVKPLKNANGDIFPESELLKAYKGWVGKPLCIDHKSSSVDFVRGVIIDTYYDRQYKRVIALCALDKVSFPELARKVKTGVSTSVSMGTAVGRAVCTDCGTVARTEHDFCNHMRTKSGYGEINLDLQPIELSIVVTGADPQAKIREILASANYLNKQAEEIEKSSSDQNVLSLKESVDTLKESLASLVDDFEGSSKPISIEQEELVSEANVENLNSETNNSESIVTVDTSVSGLKEVFASLKESIQTKISKIEEELNSLLPLAAKLDDGLRDNTMEKKSYFQGAGGVNEPTPGQPKYEKDPLAEKTRNTEDRQMAGQVDLGPVDGLFPGDLEKKKLLARADRRQSALEKAKSKVGLEKGAYYQGTEEPALGKVKYKKEEADSVRDKADKQMTGQAPFPSVGKVDGLHPSPESVDEKDELKRKQMLGRASLRAKFVKAADRADSQWQVFAGDILVLSSSVKELTNGQVDARYSEVATKDFGQQMLKNVRAHGVDKAKALYRAAQMPEIPATDMPAAPAAEAPSVPVKDEALKEVADADKGGVGSMADELAGVAKDAAEMSETLDEIVKTMKEEEPEADSVEGLAPATASLQKMRTELHSAIVAKASELSTELKEQADELALYNGSGLSPENLQHVAAMAEDAVSETKVSLAEANELLESFVNYAHGSENVVKRASYELNLKKVAEDKALDEKLDELLAEMEAEEEVEHADSDESEKEENMASDELMVDAPMTAAPMAADADDKLLSLDDTNSANVEMKAEDLAKLPSNAKVEVKMAQFDLTSKAGRAAYRAKLAADATKMNPVLDDAEKMVDSSLDDMAKVETLKEQHEAVVDVAQAPVKVRKEAKELFDLVRAGKIAAEDVDALVAHGADAEAVKYFKQMWKEVDGGSDFASELLKEHAKAKLDEEMAAYKVKIARAYDLAYQMVERGLCSRDNSVLSAQVDEIMKYNDTAFNSLKNVIARHAPLAIKKEATRLPNVGLLGNEETPASSNDSDLRAELNLAFSGGNRRY